MLAPILINFSNKCKRCGLRYPVKSEECVHCGKLSDTEMEEMLLTKKSAHQNTANIGKLFIYIMVLIVIGIVIASI